VSGSDWQGVGRVDRGRLAEARLQAHYAVQWLARAARAFVPSAPDHSHTNLGWDDGIRALTTHALPDGSVLGLIISELSLVLSSGQGASGLQSIKLDARRDADIRQWLGRELGARGLEPTALDAPSPYEMPTHPIGRGAPYASAGLAEALAELAAWYANANPALNATRQRLVERGLNAPPVRCWPHHFDLDTLVRLGAGADAPTVGVGFCPGDDYYDEPYLYVSRYPAPELATLPALPKIGNWHSRHFTAAVAVGRKIIEANDRPAEIEAFLRAATDSLIGAAA
jgi:hypothetical protein